MFSGESKVIHDLSIEAGVHFPPSSEFARVRLGKNCGREKGNMDVLPDDFGFKKVAELKNEFSEKKWWQHLLRNYKSPEAMVSGLENIAEWMDKNDFTKEVDCNMYEFNKGELLDTDMTHYIWF